jgi:hypothetical protein
MIIVLVRTYRHSKNNYLYICEAMMLGSAVFEFPSTILNTRFYGCGFLDVYVLNEKKCHGKGKPSDDWYANI